MSVAGFLSQTHMPSPKLTGDGPAAQTETPVPKPRGTRSSPVTGQTLALTETIEELWTWKT
jgi:hypothetical protein